MTLVAPFVLFPDRLDDSGVLSHKQHLPVRLLAMGDVSRPGSEAAYRVGPLQCYGDSKYQNFTNILKKNIAVVIALNDTPSFPKRLLPVLR